MRNSGAQERRVEDRAIDQVNISFHFGVAGIGKSAEEGNATEEDGKIGLERSLGSGGE